LAFLLLFLSVISKEEAAISKGFNREAPIAKREPFLKNFLLSIKGRYKIFGKYKILKNN